PGGHPGPGRPPSTGIRERRREGRRGRPRFSPPRRDMDCDLSPEHEMIRQTARDFAEKEIRPVAAHVDKTGEFPKATIAKMAGLGFMGMTIPEEYDGAGLDAVALAITVEEVARVCGSHALIIDRKSTRLNSSH